MDTLRDRLADLADDAPKGGASAADLWARGKRAHRLRATALAVTLVVVGAVGTDVGVRLASGGDERMDPAPAKTVGFALPIEYPAGEKLPELGDTPGPLAAVWLAPRGGGIAPEAVGLVAETGTFGTLPIDLPADDPDGVPSMTVALSADGRRVAYSSRATELVVHDLVTADDVSPLSELETRLGYTWLDATRLLGHVAGGSDGDGWLWEPGEAPKLVNPYTLTYGGTDLALPFEGLGPPQCSKTSPIVQNVKTRQQNGGDWAGSFDVPLLCDALGITGSGILLGHGKDPDDGNRTVIALDINGVSGPVDGPFVADPPFDASTPRRVVAAAQAPDRVTLATNLVAQALEAEGGSS